MKIQIMSDIENNFDSFSYLPSAELVLIAGDITRNGTNSEYYSASNWIKSLAKHCPVFYVGGNRDENLQVLDSLLIYENTQRLCSKPSEHAGVTFLGINQIYYKKFPYKAAISLNCSSSLSEDLLYYSGIRNSANVVVSHSPAFGVLDNGEGSPGLKLYIENKKPELVVCGHSDSPGEIPRGIYPFPKTRYINCCKQNKIIEFAL